MLFDFGQNWLNFSEKALSNDRVIQAKTDFQKLMSDIPLQDKSFLDIGFGQGLSILCAVEIGAKVVGCDINPKCAEVLKQNIKYFPKAVNTNIKTFTGSILDNATIEELRKEEPDGQGSYDVVHSWGVLHHTGNMRLAIANAASLVKSNGILVLALYNRHWSCLIWLLTKWLYCHATKPAQKVMIALLYPIIWMAKFLVTGRNPKEQSRGMDFFFNVIDWVGGYPYEYATISEIDNMLTKLDFRCIKKIRSEVPTGCNEYVFIKGNTTHNKRLPQ